MCPSTVVWTWSLTGCVITMQWAWTTVVLSAVKTLDPPLHGGALCFPVLILASTLQQFAFKCVVRELPEIFNRKADLHFNMLLKNFKHLFLV